MNKKKERNAGCNNCHHFKCYKGREGGYMFCFHPSNVKKEYNVHTGEVVEQIRSTEIEFRWNKNGFCKKFIAKEPKS